MDKPSEINGFVDMTGVRYIPLHLVPNRQGDVATMQKDAADALRRALVVSPGPEGRYGINNGYISFTHKGRVFLGEDTPENRAELSRLGLEFASVSVPFSNQEKSPDGDFIDRAQNAGVFKDPWRYFAV